MAFTLENHPDTPASLKAQQRGLRTSNQLALTSVGELLKLSGPLSWLVLLTSVFHLFSELSGVTLPGWVHIVASLALVLSIDVLAWYTTAARSAARTAGLKLNWVGQALALGLVGTLNAAYLLRHVSALPEWASYLLPYSATAYAVLLMLFVPVAYVSVESAKHVLATAQLNLLRDVEILNSLIDETHVDVTVTVTTTAQPLLPLPVQTAPVALPDGPGDTEVLEVLLSTPSETPVANPVAALPTEGQTEQDKLATAVSIYRETGSKERAILGGFGIKKSGTSKRYREAVALLTSAIG